MTLTVPFATADDLADRWRPLSTDEYNRATVLLADASQLILDEDRLGVFSEAVDPPSATLVRVVCQMVKRAMLVSPDVSAVTQLQQSAGPFAMTASYANPAGDLYLTHTERRSLGFSAQRAGHVDMWESPVTP